MFGAEGGDKGVHGALERWQRLTGLLGKVCQITAFHPHEVGELIA